MQISEKNKLFLILRRQRVSKICLEPFSPYPSIGLNGTLPFMLALFKIKLKGETMFFNALNINQLRGRIINEPELKETRTGKKLLVFNLMFFTRQSTDADGSHTNFIQVEAWQKVAENAVDLLEKGSEVIVNGSIVQKRWTDDKGTMKSNFIFSADAISISTMRFSPVQETSAQELEEDAA